MTAHRVSMLGSTLRRHEDPTQSQDPRVRGLLEDLRTIQVAPQLNPQFRDELRAQLVAVTPRLVAEGRTDDAAALATAPARSAGRSTASASASATRQKQGRAAAGTADSFWHRLRGIRLARPLAVAASIVTVFALLLGGAVYMSRNALPGDSLYGVKRASEQFQLFTDSNDSQRAQDHLDFAGTRVDEAQALLSHPSAGSGGLQADTVSARTSTMVATALAEADTDTRAASRLLGEAALQSSSGAPLAPMTAWAPQQLQRLQDLAAAAPAGSLRNRVTASWTVVKEVDNRARVLQRAVACKCMTASNTDLLGPIPCVQCTPAAPRPVSPPATTRTPNPTAAIPPTTGTLSRPVTVPTRSAGPGGTLGTAPTTTPGPRKTTGNLPHLPPITLPPVRPSKPLIGISSCSISLIGLVLPLCPSHTP